MRPFMNSGRVAAVLAIVVAMGLTGCAERAPDPATSPAVDPTDLPTASQTPAPTLPTTVDGLTVMTVSELLAARQDGKADAGPSALKGYWSMPDLGFSCPATMAVPGELEMYCRVWSFGITELDEMALEIHRSANQTSARPPAGPRLVPFVSEPLLAVLRLEPVGAQPHPPVPLVVVGHFDDPRAAACQPEARQACLDRFVLDRVVVFDPAAVPAPTPTPIPSPFPFDSPPAAPFAPARCSASGVGAAGPFSFVGWMPGEQIPGSMGVDYSGVVLYVAITRDAVPLGEWSDASPRWRPMGRMICIGREGESGAVQFDSVRGSTFRQLEDGSTTPPLP